MMEFMRRDPPTDLWQALREVYGEAEPYKKRLCVFMNEKGTPVSDYLVKDLVDKMLESFRLGVHTPYYVANYTVVDEISLRIVLGEISHTDVEVWVDTHRRVLNEYGVDVTYNSPCPIALSISEQTLRTATLKARANRNQDNNT